MADKIIQIDPADNVAVALVDLQAGKYPHSRGEFQVNQPVQRKHKFLLTDVPKGEKIIMYGVPVGTALVDLQAGDLLHMQNTAHFAEDVRLENKSSYAWTAPDVSKWKDRTFLGYRRADGSVGTANYWLFIPLVFCENRNLKVIEEAMTKGLGYKSGNKYENYVKRLIADPQIATEDERPNRVFKNIDGIKFLYHHGGCGGTRQDSETLLRLLAAYVNHPNVAGATVLSLGCQHAQISWYQEIQSELFPNSKKPLIFLEQQQIKSEELLIKSAIDQTVEALHEANKLQREPAPLSHLTVGLECGGSDGFSGISANPAVGHVSDLLAALGGTSILSEFPELNGVEQNLVDRSVSRGVAEKFLKIQRAYEQQAKAAGSGFDMNPSPGNIKDGLITDAMKSAGAAKKGGSSPVVDVLDYTETVKRQGLNLLCTPGNDVESTTGLAAAGANIILFTTGLGTPTGNPITPVIKISTNTHLYESMNELIDVNAGTIISGEKTITQLGEELLEEIIAVASGKATKAMKLAQDDFIPWKRGVSL